MRSDIQTDDLLLDTTFIPQILCSLHEYHLLTKPEPPQVKGDKAAIFYHDSDNLFKNITLFPDLLRLISKDHDNSALIQLRKHIIQYQSSITSSITIPLTEELLAQAYTLLDLYYLGFRHGMINQEEFGQKLIILFGLKAKGKEQKIGQEVLTRCLLRYSYKYSLSTGKTYITLEREYETGKAISTIPAFYGSKNKAKNLFQINNLLNTIELSLKANHVDCWIRDIFLNTYKESKSLPKENKDLFLEFRYLDWLHNTYIVNPYLAWDGLRVSMLLTALIGKAYLLTCLHKLKELSSAEEKLSLISLRALSQQAFPFSFKNIIATAFTIASCTFIVYYIANFYLDSQEKLSTSTHVRQEIDKIVASKEQQVIRRDVEIIEDDNSRNNTSLVKYTERW